VCVEYGGVKEENSGRSHKSRYTIHPKENKMYQDFKRRFWWSSKNKDVAQYVFVCLICQKIKAEHQKATGLLQPLPVP
jgi:hypothetical protein